MRNVAPSKIAWSCPATSSSGPAQPGANRPNLVRVRNRLPGVIHTLAVGFPPDWGSLKSPLASFQIQRTPGLLGSYLPQRFSVSLFCGMPPCEFARAPCYKRMIIEQ